MFLCIHFRSSYFSSESIIRLSALSNIAVLCDVCDIFYQINVSQTEQSTMSSNGLPSQSVLLRCHSPRLFRLASVLPPFSSRCISTVGSSVESASQDASAPMSGVAPRIKFKRPDKTGRHIMQASIDLVKW